MYPILLIIARGKLEIVSCNKIEGEVYATPAVTDNKMLIRTATHLYCIGTK